MLDTPATPNGVTADPQPSTARPRRSGVDVECALTDLEGLAVALKIVRHGDDTFVGLSHTHPDYRHALNAMVDAVLDQVGKVSKAARGEPLLALEPYGARADAAGYDQDGEDDEDDEPFSRALTAAMHLSNVNGEHLTQMPPKDKHALIIQCRRVLAEITGQGNAEPEAA